MGQGGHTNQKPVYWEVTLFKGFFLGSVRVGWVEPWAQLSPAHLRDLIGDWQRLGDHESGQGYPGVFTLLLGSEASSIR